MPRVFISYRRRDSPYVAEMLRDALQERLGPSEVFFDIDNIPFGVDFREHISSAVGSCNALVVVIGDHWLTLKSDDGMRRLDDPADPVRIEIESALKRKIPVVPVLVDEARIPGATHLPETMRDLAFRNAAEIRAGRDLKHHVARLVSSLAAILESAAPLKISPSESSATVRDHVVHPLRLDGVYRSYLFVVYDHTDRGYDHVYDYLRFFADGTVLGYQNTIAEFPSYNWDGPPAPPDEVAAHKLALGNPEISIGKLQINGSQFEFTTRSPINEKIATEFRGSIDGDKLACSVNRLYIEKSSLHAGPVQQVFEFVPMALP